MNIETIKEIISMIQQLWNWIATGAWWVIGLKALFILCVVGGGLDAIAGLIPQRWLKYTGVILRLFQKAKELRQTLKSK